MQTLSIYHIHTEYCGDCDVPLEDSIAKAIGHGFKRIGFSVHTPWPHDKPSRISNANFHVYVQEAERLRKKYAGKIEVLCGIEGEYDPLFKSYFTSLVQMPGVDFMSFGLHYLDGTIGNRPVTRVKLTVDELYEYGRQWVEAMSTGLFMYAVHPDYFMVGYAEWDEHTEKVSRQIIQKAVELNLPLGYDMKYRYSSLFGTPRAIPAAPFWKIAIEMNAPLHVELDAHDLDRDWREMITQGEQDLKAMGAKNIITQFPLRGAKKEIEELK